MKMIAIIVAIIFFCTELLVFSYQPMESDGLVGALLATTPAYRKKQQRSICKRRLDGLASNVMTVEGFADFEKLVVAGSCIKPVVVLVLSPHDADTNDMKNVVCDVAQMFNNRVCFLVMTMPTEHDDQREGNVENTEIMGTIMQQANIVRLELPLIIFFKDGGLYAPVHEPTVFLQGMQKKDALAAYIERKYFANQERVVHDGMHDMTFTRIGAHLSRSEQNKNTQKRSKASSPGVFHKIIKYFRKK